ncbi:lantibiotic immunity ABC transporter MutG family permease subunit [Blautia producta]|uniref:Lantibiotic immunity ABC transporter MutG family permease subunit n=2 Tax=Blautia producta TaxID=33035 RepID=A0A7G5MU88_9FIRM|nr:lantibiotic immunity ABC transporter MutG family permease subunit [Blautia producta]QIB53663.1 lantibiotic immunity ABC transporter MutG family permease subunit [Blautia producta ATCC 27340 = DSM 2950]QMW78181.1 lantibiotic immunity ABC transporter MutG family permease subunit [Blautia producta]HBG4837488.1 lantibiotic immunity ABC transporter MutG family permease subunit [Clostridioides difficile]HDF2668449.1 lantibiotic immunity ABC transporter MutG family permease subunit [Clostridioides 
MSNFIRYIHAEMIKSKHSPILLIHLVFPLIGALVFAGYFHISGWKPEENVSAFLQTVAILFPFLIGIVVGLVIQLENQAGHFQQMLGDLHRCTIYISKIAYLLLLAAMSSILCFGIFYALYPVMPLDIYIKAFGYLLLSVFPIYLLSLLLGLMFGKSVTMGLGIVGSLIAALMLTGLGDNVWQFIPWAWGVRFMDYCIVKYTNPNILVYISSSFKMGVILIMSFTIVLAVFSLLWFNYWEGTNENE